MEIEQKYVEFSNVVLNEASETKRKILRETQEEFLRLSSIYKNDLTAKSEKQINLEFEKKDRERNKVLIGANQDTRKILNDKKMAFTEKIFDRVKDMLVEFLGSPDYKTMLFSYIDEAKAVLGEPIEIEVTERDFAYKHELESAKNVSVKKSSVDFIGGLLARSPSKSMVVNLSLKAKLADEFEKFNSFKVM